MEKTKLINELYRWPAEKLPPCGLYCKLSEFAGLRNGWTVKQWLNYLRRLKKC